LEKRSWSGIRARKQVNRNRLHIDKVIVEQVFVIPEVPEVSDEGTTATYLIELV
jgi:hypothetical protein